MSEEKLIPVIAQDIRNNNVLMFAYANDESLELTKKTGFMHYWSRSRNKIWKKGETSGHYQKVYELLYDCDRDTILARVEQEGCACHTGSYSCFSDAPLGQEDIISQLWRVFEDRKSNPDEKSYTCKLLRDENKMLKKLAEESAEVIMAAKEEDRAQIVYETGDLLYHLMVMLFSKDITMDEVFSELQRRRK
ncbi:MAG TPA: bifunctional phosphoribosyl-AMP cyclohydrolase/phosphoribosyl-ATP diphosphatase HisIE [Euryarchaeota archaeon]|nr:bifunctional phosphoribosyl-AMP cyclohydrolase/phosphoribosyl-ATP diphosphatase HisIE [Euryarchaeota archaeon]